MIDPAPVAVTMPSGAKMTIWPSGAIGIEAGGDGAGMTIEAGADQPSAPEAVICPGDGCKRAVIARPDAWTRCACGTETTLLP